MLLPFLTAAIVILVDQVTKALLAAYLPTLPERTLPLIENVLHLTYVENRGAAFGMLADHRWVFMVLSVVGLAAIVLITLREKPKSVWIRVAVGLVLGGGIANMIDRVRLGYVVDFIDCRFIDFYVFNVADSCITVAAAILIVSSLFPVRSERSGNSFVAVLIMEFRSAKAKKAAEAEGAPTDEDSPDENAETPVEESPAAESAASETERAEDDANSPVSEDSEDGEEKSSSDAGESSGEAPDA